MAFDNDPFGDSGSTRSSQPVGPTARSGGGIGSKFLMAAIGGILVIAGFVWAGFFSETTSTTESLNPMDLLPYAPIAIGVLIIVLGLRPRRH